MQAILRSLSKRLPGAGVDGKKGIPYLERESEKKTLNDTVYGKSSQ